MFNPLSLLSSAGSAVASFFGGFQTYLIIGAVSLAVGGAGGAWVGYRMESGKVAAIQAADAEANTQAQTKETARVVAEGQVQLKAAEADDKAQAKIQVQTVTITKEVPVYVPQNVSCVGLTVGLARVLRAASEGVDPSTLSLAPGQSDNDCSDVAPAEVAGWFAQYAGAAQANSQQLNDLIAWAKADHTAQETAQ